MILCDNRTIKAGDLNLSRGIRERTVSENYSLDIIEKEAVSKALDKAAGNISIAAKLLGISRTTLYSKMKKHDL